MKKLHTRTQAFILKSFAVILLTMLAMTSVSIAASLTTDASDYAPGSFVTFTGSGFHPGELVTMQVVHADDPSENAEDPAHQPWDVEADASGNFTTTWEVNTDGDQLGATLLATADGQMSGEHAEAIFTDGPDGTGVVTVTATGGNCLSYTASNAGGPDNWEVAQGATYHMTITGVSECSESTITVNIQSSNVGNWCFDATQTSAGVYEGDFTMPNPSCFTMPISYSCGSGTDCGGDGTYNANGPSNTNKVHLRANNFGSGCSSPVLDDNCSTISTCTDGIQNQGETGIDVGGPCENNCPPNSVSISANGPTTFCQGGSVLLCATGATSYSWSNGSTDACITVTASGDYTVTGFGPDGCPGTSSASQSVTVNPPPTVSISANGPTTFCQGGSVQLCASGTATSFVWSPGGSTNTCITVSSAGTYSVVGTDANSCSAPSNSITVTVNPPPTVSISANGPTTFCQGGSVQLCASGTATSFVWSPGGSTNSCITVSSAGTYSVVGTNSNGCTAASNSITVTVNPNPTCSITNNNSTVICGLSYTASVTTNPATGVTRLWSVSGSGWSINGSATGSSVNFTAGPGTGTLSVAVTITATGCVGGCSTNITANCTEGCSYTQGFYGNTGKNCQQQTALTAINAALSQGSLTAGTSGHSIVFGTTEGSCLMSHLPSGTTPSQLPAFNKTCATATGSQYLSGNKYADVLLGQVLALGISMRNTSGLGSIVVNGAYVTTYKASACSNGVAVAGTKTVKGPIPAAIFTALGSSFTVSALWTAANNALGNGSTTPSLSNWTAALDVINNGFDGCRILAGFGSSSSGLKLDDGATATSDASVSILAYPNPTNDVTTVEFTSTETSDAIVELFNMNGQKMSVLYNGSVEAGNKYTVQVDAKQLQPGIYLCRYHSSSVSETIRMVVVK